MEMDSQNLVTYMQETDGLFKPWLLVQLRLKKLQEGRAERSPEQYAAELADIHNDLMNLGEWWQGIEHEVF